MKRILLAAMAIVLLAAVIGSAAPLKVGITKIVEHEALDAVEQGVIDALTAAGYVRGVDVEYLLANAQGEYANAIAIAQDFQAQEVDLVVAISTPSALAAAQVFGNTATPVVFAAITAPEEYGLDAFSNVTGVSDLIDPALDLKLLQDVRPGMKSVGIVYNPGEANSAYLTAAAEQAAKALGISIVTASAENSAAVQQAAQSLSGRVDGIYVTTDNTVASALEAVVAVAVELKVPLLMADPFSIAKGPTICAGWDYYSHGLLVGDFVVRILAGSPPSEIPITYQRDTQYGVREILLQLDTAELSGIVFTDEVIGQATGIYFRGVKWERAGR
jgi:putative ABC transport system substrate-binding protein